jgi:ACS family tartrate transporter-like MFS transporter
MPLPIPELLELRTMRKIRWRILSLAFLLYLIAFLDRANVAYAKTQMSLDLGFSEAVYGFGAGLFFLGYVLLEIPGALIVVKWGARFWISRILLTWGICTVLVGLIHSPFQFYAARFTLGLAEAGLFPGLVVYINQWFPSRYRARAFGTFFTSGPIALMIGGPISGLILRLSWLNMPGWRWVFILEGLPALIMGVLLWLLMPDQPEKATWLDPAEREWICSELNSEKDSAAAFEPVTVFQALRHRTVLILALVTFLANIGISGFFLWLPSTVERVSGVPSYLAAMISGLPFATAVGAILVCSWSSDRIGERRLHTAIPLILAALVFPITTISALPFGWLLFWLCIAATGIYGFGPSFFVLPSLVLDESALAAAIGLITMFSGLGGFVGPTVVGNILSLGYPFSIAVFFLSFCFLAAGTVLLLMRSKLTRKGKKNHERAISTGLKYPDGSYI